MTLGELTEWTVARTGCRKNNDLLDARLETVPVIGYDEEVARIWGRLSAATRRARRSRPVNDMWNAACCRFEGLPRHLERQGLPDFVDHHGLVVLGAG